MFGRRELHRVGISTSLPVCEICRLSRPFRSWLLAEVRRVRLREPSESMYDAVMIALDRMWPQKDMLLEKKDRVQAGYRLALDTPEKVEQFSGRANTAADAGGRQTPDDGAPGPQAGEGGQQARAGLRLQRQKLTRSRDEGRRAGGVILRALRRSMAHAATARRGCTGASNRQDVKGSLEDYLTLLVWPQCSAITRKLS